MRGRIERLLAGLSLASMAVLSGGVAQAQYGAKDGEWRSYGGDLGSTKYSALDQIDADNFASLTVAWKWQSVDGELDLEELRSINRGIRPTSLKATPLMAGGVLYVGTPLGQAAAINASTGKTIWSHDPKSYLTGSPTNILGFNSRGVAYWTDGEEERIFWGTGDGYLIAVDAKTGEPCSDFGDNGRVDLTVGIPRADRSARDYRGRHWFSVSSPPIVARDVVVTPASISDDPMFKEAPPGWIRGFDVRTGEVKWTFHTVPQEGDVGVETWLEDSWKYSGNTNVWSMMSVDEELGYLYLPIGTPTNDFYGGHRPGNNLFGESLVCLDIETGERIWHHQMVRHGLWDYDNPAAPNLIDITVDGKRIKAVAQVTKQGYCYVFDRVTGEPVWPFEERPAPSSDIAGEWTAPTQLHPTKPPAFEAQGVTIDDLIDFTPELRREAIEIVEGYRIGPLYTPPSLRVEGRQGTIQRPGWTGGANWTGAAVDPETGILYVPSVDTSSITILSVPDPSKSNLRYVRAGVGGVRGPQGLPLFKPPYSSLTAIDLNLGEFAWRIPIGMGSDRVRNHEALQGLDLPALGGGSRSGPLLTKTLLITAQSTRGSGGRGGRGGGGELVARDRTTGAVVASVSLPSSAIGTPMTYMLNGKQYIALTVRASPVPEVIALALP